MQITCEKNVSNQIHFYNKMTCKQLSLKLAIIMKSHTQVGKQSSPNLGYLSGFASNIDLFLLLLKFLHFTMTFLHVAQRHNLSAPLDSLQKVVQNEYKLSKFYQGTF